MEVVSFTKMEGLGNDYVIVEDWNSEIKDPEISNRHFGVGSDGLILICSPSAVSTGDKKRCRMRMFNSDGSESVQKADLEVETLAGIIHTSVHLNHQRVKHRTSEIVVDMGIPSLSTLPLQIEDALNERVTNFTEKLKVDDSEYEVTLISMGNPHCILFVKDFDFDYHALGRKIETHPRFPSKTNVEFIRVKSREEIEMRVWERGSGETMACGTGACASVVACVLHKLTDTIVTVHLLGGPLKIEWNQHNRIIMTGPASYVCKGEYYRKN